MCTSLDAAIERVGGLGDSEVKEHLRQVYASHVQSFAELVATVAALENRGVASAAGFKPLRVAQLVKQLTRMSLGDSKTVVKMARLTSRQPAGGSAFADTELPATALALADGAINPGHVREIINTMENIPVNWPGRDAFEQSLATAARSAYPEDVRDLGKRIAELIEQETPPDDDELAQPRRRLRITQRADGRVLLAGMLDRETAVKLEAFLSAFAKPRKGEPDYRDKQQRQGDALAELVHHGVTCTGVLPNDTRPKIIFTLSWEDLQKDVNRILMTGYGVISPEAARRLCCDAEIIPAVLSGNGLVLDVGKSSRTATTAIRRALILRDGGCCFPGCDRPAYWCDAHHVKEWEFGGRTAMDNMVLLCLAHHQIVHHTQWSILMLGGIPHFVPPDYVDPSQTPIRHARYSMKC